MPKLLSRPLLPFLGLVFSLAILGACCLLLMQDLGWWGLVAFGMALVAGRWLRRTFVTLPRLQKAEAAWAKGLTPAEVFPLVPQAGGGELGRQVLLMKSKIWWALGDRTIAWMTAFEADMWRVSWPWRSLVRRVTRHLPESPSSLLMGTMAFLRWLHPRSGRIQHLCGLLQLRRGRTDEAWRSFELALSFSEDDPMLLDDLMRAGFSLEKEAVGEHAMRLLMHHHGDPRIPWDRPAALHHLLMRGRMMDALSLAHPLPHEFRTHPLHWLGESIPLRALGNIQASWDVLDAGLKRLPLAFPLWMERVKLSLELNRDEETLAALQSAKDCLPSDASAARAEWSLRRAETAWWIEGDAESAWQHLMEVPLEQQGGQHPPLRLQLLSALGRFDEALAELGTHLVERPKDPALLLLQAECMAGKQAWNDLLPFLEGLPHRCREHASYWHLRGLALAHLEDYLGARVDLERSVRMDPSRVRHLLDAGHACAELGEWARAEGHWRQALELESDNEEALIQLSDARRELHDTEGSRRYLRECLMHYPDSADAQDRLAELERN